MNNYLFIIFGFLILQVYILLYGVFSKKLNQFFGISKNRYIKVVYYTLIILLIFVLSLLFFKFGIDSYNSLLNRSVVYINWLSLCIAILGPFMLIGCVPYFDKYTHSIISKILLFMFSLVFMYYINYYFIFEICLIINIIGFINFFLFLKEYFTINISADISFEYLIILYILFCEIYFLMYNILKFL